MEFNLTKEQFKILTQGNCYYCSSVPKQIVKKKDLFGEYIYNGIDRIDNDKGYTFNNCVSCCKICNTIKRKQTKENFIISLKEYYKLLKNKFESNLI